MISRRNRQKVNPLIIREMRGRMRGRRAFVILTIYLMLLSCVAGSVYTLIYSENISQSVYSATAPNTQFGPLIGKSIFTGTVLLLLMIVSFIAPAFTTGSIAGERERQTYDLLVITPLRAAQIVWGKLGAVFIFLLLLIITSLPIQSLAFLFGGVALEEIAIAALAMVITALAFGTLGLFISSLVRTTMVAIIVAYGIGVPVIYGLPFILFYFVSSLLSPFSLIANEAPAVIIVILVYGIGLLLSINPFSAALLTGTLAANGYGYFFFKETVDTVTLWFISPWVVYVLFYSLLTIFLIWLTIRRLSRISDI